jgi:peroxiredoxin
MFVGVVAAGDEMLQVGMLAPEFTATAFDGRTISLADLRAKGPVVLVFLRSCG